MAVGGLIGTAGVVPIASGPMRSPRALLVPVVALGLLVSACGDSSSDASTASTDSAAPADSSAGGATTAPPTDPNALAKPAVSIPKELPTELVITDLTTGTGHEAEAGDTVVVHYVGVRSADGAEFDNSYDRGEPFPVVLGQNSVIQGWEQGLVGIQAGGRRQLDIPSDLAYGDSPQGEVIQAGDALTFVIDAVAILPATNPADEPKITITPGPNVDAVSFEDLVTGTGDPVKPGQTVGLHLIAFRADTGEQIASSWESGSIQSIPYAEGATLPGIYAGLDGITVGTRRQITIPFSEAWGADGNTDIGLPGSTDLVVVIDVFAIY